jgi:hypothetical protein
LLTLFLIGHLLLDALPDFGLAFRLATLLLILRLLLAILVLLVLIGHMTLLSKLVAGQPIMEKCVPMKKGALGWSAAGTFARYLLVAFDPATPAMGAVT